MLRVGILGCGRFGSALAAGFAQTPRTALTVCADLDAAAAAACAAAVGGRAASPEALWSSRDVDAVAVATPNATHRACVEASLAAGKHVWCEKPMALAVEDCDAMMSAARRAGVRLTVGHMQRHFPLLAAVRAEVAAGHLGDPLAVSLARREYLRRDPGWLRQRSAVGGLQYQSSVHEFDWLRSAFGDVVAVHARGVQRPLQPALDFPDGLFVTLEFRTGCIGSLQACMTDFVGAYRGEINGREGSLHFDLLAGTYRVQHPDGRQREVAVPGGALSEAYAIGALRARTDFVRWVLDDVPPDLTAWDGRQAAAIACAVTASLASGGPEAVADPPSLMAGGA